MTIATQLRHAWDTGSTLPEVLAGHARTAQGMVFVGRDDGQEVLSYGGLSRNAAAAALRLRAAGVRPGDPVLLCCDSELLLVNAFWSVLHAGAVAVPLSVPRSYSADDDALQKLRAVHRQCSAGTGRTALLITDLDRAALARGDGGEALTAGAMAASDLLGVAVGAASGDTGAPEPAGALAGEASPCGPGAADRVALLMFSSGSTGDPKGVRLTHRELLANCTQIAERSQLRASDRSLSWLPLTHDMGLILFHLCHALAGIDQFKMTPLAFARDPGGFLDRASAVRATLLGMPNFGFDQLRRAAAGAPRGRWALDAVRVIYNGAEPIDPQLCREVYRSLGGHGLGAGTISPGWGIAESCVVATQFPQAELVGRGELPVLHVTAGGLMAVGSRMDVRDRAGPDTREIVALGPVMEGMRLRVLDADGMELPEGHLGHMQLRGPNVSRGYFGQKDAEWCETGDLGFVLDGIVYLTGRAKDVVFINGRNHFSNDLETALARLTDWPAGQLAVVGASDPSTRRERVVVFFRQGRESVRGEQSRRLREALEGLIGYPVAAAIGMAALPKTTSGKIRRFQLRQELMQGEFASVLDAADDTRKRTAKGDEAELARLVREVCPTLPEDPDPALPLSRYGLDSVGFMQLGFRIQQHYRRDLTAQALLRAASLEAISRLLAAAPPPGAVDNCQYGRTVPMTARQQMLWTAWLLDPRGNAYHETYSVQLAGSLDASQWLDAARRVIACHPMLSAVVQDGAAPALVLHPVQRADVEHIACDPQDADALLAELAARPFDLRAGPLLRLRLLTSCHGATVVLSAHHLVVDGWSLQLLLSQIFSVYAGGELPDVENQLWFTPVRGEAAVRGEWQRRIELADVVQLPAAARVDAIDTAARGPARSCRVALSAAATHALHDWRRDHGGEFTALAAALAVLMGRLATVSRPLLGTVIHGRFDAVCESRVGYFATTHALLVDLDEHASFAALAGSLEQQKAALLSGHTPDLASLAQGAGVALVDAVRVVYVHQNMPPLAGADGQRITAQVAYRGLARSDLTVTTQWCGDVLEVDWEYDSHRFSDAQVAGYAELFDYLLGQLLADPDRAHAQADLLSPGQRALWMPFDNTGVRVDFGRSVIARFEAAAADWPHAPAVSDDRSSYSYAELRERVDALCLQLQAVGLAPGDRLCLLTGRGADYAIALLAALKCGGVAIPVDPALPAERIALILDDSRASVLLTTPDARVDGALHAGRRVVCFSGQDLASGAIAECRVPEPDSPAYLIYTSGSTGRPKGVVATHRCLANLVHWVADAFDYRAGETICQYAPFSFDVSIAEILPSLCAGLHVHVLSNERRASPELYLRTLHERRVNVATVTPAYLAVVNELPDQARVQLQELRLLILGGEALPAEEVERFRAHSPHVRVVNVYGPTETTVLSTAYPLPDPLPATRGWQPLGWPIANTELWVLDAHDRVCTATVTGTVHIGGAGLAQGYWQDPERTASAFRVLAPDGGTPRRFYCTGDLARLGTDGLLDFVGRADTQLKLRGFRIEPGEIEAVLTQMPGVEGAVVKALAHDGGERVLVAYHGGEDHSRAQLDAFLRARLPAYMLPSHYQHVSAWPLTTNRKIDRQSLPEPDWNRHGRIGDHAPPQGETETRLAAIWSGLLGQTQVGRDDHFFLLGGSSLTAVQLVNRIREAFGRSLGLPAVMQHATLRAMAAVIEADAAVVASDEAPRARRAASLERVPASEGQARMYFLDRNNPGSPLNNIPLTLELSGALDGERLHAALQALAQRHPILRTAFELGEDGVVLRTGEAVAIDLALSQVDGDDDALEALRAFHRRGYDLTRPPLWRVAVVTAAASGRAWLALGLHHAIADGVTLGRLLADLDALYQGRPVPSRSDEVEYADYAVWHRDRLAGEFGDRARAYWERPEHLPPPLRLPGGNGNGIAGRQFIAALDPGQTAALKSWCRQQGTTPFVAMLALFGAALGKRCGMPHFAVGVTFAGRTHRALEATPGLFVNTLPLGFGWSEDDRLSALMHRAQTRLAALQEFEDYPLNRVMAAGSRREFPFNVLLNEEVLPPDLSFGGQPAALAAVDVGIAKMPLVLSFMFGGDTWRWRVEHRFDGPARRWLDALTDDVRMLVDGLAELGDVAIGELQALDGELLALLDGA